MVAVSTILCGAEPGFIVYTAPSYSHAIKSALGVAVKKRAPPPTNSVRRLTPPRESI